MLSVIIVNYNSGERLKRCLACLDEQDFRDFEIIVFDNASSDASLAPARDRARDRNPDENRIRIVESRENLGFAAANNRAAAIACGEWLVFLNPDAYAAQDWLTRLLAASARHPGVDAFGSAQLNAAHPDIIDGAGDVLHAFGVAYRGGFGAPAPEMPQEGVCLAACAAAAMYRKTTFDALGGFDERFFCYGEDVDLGLRLAMDGGRTVQVADARVLHEGSGVTGRHSDFSVYHGHRNRIWLHRKNFPAALYFGLAPLRAATDAAMLVRMMMIGAGGSYLRALRDGYFGGGAIRNENAGARRRSRLGASGLARRLEWSPLALARRSPHTLPAETA